jgi:hypothetical protein
MQDGLPPLQPWEREEPEEVKKLVVEIAEKNDVTDRGALCGITRHMARTDAYDVYTRDDITDEFEKEGALKELRNVIQSEVDKYKQYRARLQSQPQARRISNDNQNDDDQEKCSVLGVIVVSTIILLVLGILGALPGLGIAILVGVKFASHFSKALKFGLGIFFIAPLAVTIFAVVTFFLKSFIKSKLAAQSQINEVKDNVVQTDAIDVQAQEQDMNEQASDIGPTH